MFELLSLLPLFALVPQVTAVVIYSQSYPTRTYGDAYIIVRIVIPLVLLLLSVIFAIWYLRKRSQRMKEKQQQQQALYNQSMYPNAMYQPNMPSGYPQDLNNQPGPMPTNSMNQVSTPQEQQPYNPQ